MSMFGSGWKDSDGYLIPQLEALEKDKARLDFINQNFYSREMDELDKKLHKDKNMWVFFAPNDVQGDIRDVIDRAMEYAGKNK